MPPNRKGAFDTADSLATLNVSQFVQVSKFQPLTNETAPVLSTQGNEEGPNPIAVVVQSKPQPEPCNDDPAKTALVQRILTEERLREQFSADHILRSIQDGAEEKTEDLHREANAAEADDYWAMTTPSDLNETVKARHTDSSYWDWPTKNEKQQKDETLQKILEQERIRELFSVDHIEQKIREEAAAQQKKQSLLPQSDSYWEWNAKVNLNDADLQPDKAEQAEIIQHILEAEKLRQQFSVEAIERKLIQEEQKEDTPSQAVASNDDYWAEF